MRSFFKSAPFKLILTVVTILLLALLYTKIFPDNNFIENGISYITVQFQRGMAWLFDKSGDYMHVFREKEELQSENEILQREISRLRDKTIDYYNLKEENKSLKNLYGMKEKDDSLKFVRSDVIGKSDTLDSSNFIIDRGSDDGISVGDAVITDKGFVGSVCKVSACSSYVRTILSADCKVGVIGVESREEGVLMGNLNFSKDGLTRMAFISAQSPIKHGEMIVTGGIGGMYPKNLKIGKVTKTSYDEHDSFYYAVVEPFQNIKEVKSVYVINDFENKGKIEILNSSDTEK